MSKRFYFIALSFISAFGLIVVSSVSLSIRGYLAVLLSLVSSLLLLAVFRLKIGKFSPKNILSLFGPTLLLPLGFGLIFVHFPNFSVFFRLLVYIFYLISLFQLKLKPKVCQIFLNNFLLPLPHFRSGIFYRLGIELMQTPQGVGRLNPCNLDFTGIE